VTNEAGAASGYTRFLAPQYYRGISSAEAISFGALWYAGGGGSIYYPTGVWGAPYTGTSNLVTTNAYRAYGNTNNIDGNFNALDSMDADYTRTLTDMVTVSGDTTITSATASFVDGDLKKFIIADNFTRGRVIDCAFTNADATVTCASGNFTAGDVGRHVSTTNRTTIGLGAQADYLRIASVTNSTTIELDGNANATATVQTIFAEPFIVSITNGTTAEMSVPATASQSGKTLVIGYTNQGYPLLDQPGRGYFPSANAGNWPLSASYTEANYEQLMPIYTFGNLWTSGGSTSNPPATSLSFVSTAGYMKADREWYDPVGRVQTSSSSPFDGTTGTGFGTLANRPATCEPGVGYWAYDQGSWNTSGKTYTYFETNGGTGTATYSQGVFYKCTATDTWTTYFTPYAFPHPLATP
jgi:hypothetical protein